MATKAKKSAPAKTSQAKVTRITARDTEKVVTEKPTTKPAATQPKERTSKSGFFGPFVALGGYFKGAWYELQQVTWPSRKATWSLTLALLAFTLFFVIIILLLDAGFQYLFELILG
ncbi:MAG TPA: preprotein translocase subunit SecE [Candidatus Saccharimonadales bacterium]